MQQHGSVGEFSTAVAAAKDRSGDCKADPSLASVLQHASSACSLRVPTTAAHRYRAASGCLSSLGRPYISAFQSALSVWPSKCSLGLNLIMLLQS